MSRDPWTLMRWAREQAAEHSLSATQAHVLLVLASYADVRSGECHAKRITIARDVVRGERETSRALTDLARLGLIERHGRGPGRPTVTRLLACGLPRIQDVRPTAHQDPDVRPTAHPRRVAHDPQEVRPTTPKTCGPPHIPSERPLEPPQEQPPQPPTGGDVTLASAPLTAGGRRRDQDTFKQLWTDLTAEHFPGAHPGGVRSTVADARRSGVESTPENVRAYAERRGPAFVAALAPSLGGPEEVAA